MATIAARWVCSIVLLYGAVGKLVFPCAATQHVMLVTTTISADAVVVVAVACEAWVGLTLVLFPGARWSAIQALSLLAVYSAYLVTAMLHHQEHLRCACLMGLDMPASLALVRNMLMIAAVAFTLRTRMRQGDQCGGTDHRV